jgi:hypothetical protein
LLQTNKKLDVLTETGRILLQEVRHEKRLEADMADGLYRTCYGNSPRVCPALTVAPVGRITPDFIGRYTSCRGMRRMGRQRRFHQAPHDRDRVCLNNWSGKTGTVNSVGFRRPDERAAFFWGTKWTLKRKNKK